MSEVYCTSCYVLWEVCTSVAGYREERETGMEGTGVMP